MHYILYIIINTLTKCILKKKIKPLGCSSLILEQTICLETRGLYVQTYLESRTPRSRDFFRDVDRSIALQSQYMQLRVKLFVLNENAAKYLHLHLHLNPSQSTQPSHAYDYSVKISDPDKRDLYTCGVWFESVDSVADLCPTNQLLYQTFNLVLLNSL